MNSSFKFAIKRYILPLFAVSWLQPLYRLIHRISLVGMNIGPVGEVETSGEAKLIKKLMALAPSDAVICDVGANIGEFSIRCVQAASEGAMIYAFEPSPSTYQRLKDRLLAVPGGHRVAAVEVGLSDQIRETTISVPAGYEGGASIHARVASQMETRTEKIRLTTLDAFCAEKDVRHIFFLKLDIEGEEFACLRGATRLLSSAQIDYLQFEFGGCDVQSRVFLRDFWILLSPSFQLYRILQNGLEPWLSYHELDEIFTTTNFLAVRRNLPRPS